MNEDPPSLSAVPRAAAVAGVAFALLFGAALLMVRLSIPGSIVERGGWLADPAGNLRLATHLLAWGGIAFLWFIGVVRTHIGAREDRFLASVYFGSGVLFLAMCFVAAAGTQALLGKLGSDQNLYRRCGDNRPSPTLRTARHRPCSPTSPLLCCTGR